MNYIKLMQSIIEKTGDLVVSQFRQNIQISSQNGHGIVTNVDLESQKILIAGLTQVLPGSGCIAEEGNIAQMQEFTWVIDPIDGTRNFVRGLPYFCINVALMQQAELIAAITYQPITKEWFCAQRGIGAFLNENSLNVQQRWKQIGIIMVVSDATLRNGQFLNKVKQLFKNIEVDVRFRVNGAVALDLAYTAAGMFDVVLFQNLAWWDVAAGVLLVQEAGGWVSQHDGLAVNQTSKTLIAGDPQLCTMIINLINEQK